MLGPFFPIFRLIRVGQSPLANKATTGISNWYLIKAMGDITGPLSSSFLSSLWMVPVFLCSTELSPALTPTYLEDLISLSQFLECLIRVFWRLGYWKSIFKDSINRSVSSLPKPKAVPLIFNKEYEHPKVIYFLHQVDSEPFQRESVRDRQKKERVALNSRDTVTYTCTNTQGSVWMEILIPPYNPQCSGARGTWLTFAHTNTVRQMLTHLTHTQARTHTHKRLMLAALGMLWLISHRRSTRAIHYRGSTTERTRERWKERSALDQVEMRRGRQGGKKSESTWKNITMHRDGENVGESIRWKTSDASTDGGMGMTARAAVKVNGSLAE